MRIVQIAAEFAPAAKAGGLGEVVVGLSRELTRIHEDVEVIIPKHDFIHPSFLSNAKIEVPEFKCLENGKHHSNTAWIAELEGCRVHLLDARHPAGYFHRGKIYGCEDDVPRFLYFCRAVVEYLRLSKKPIDVLQLHDWHTAPVALLIRDLFAKEIQVKKIVLTIHNVEYQGKCAAQDLTAIGLNGPSYLTPAKLQDDNPTFPQTINLLKGGIVYADDIVAVSPTYAKEILTPTGGFGLDQALRANKSKLTGILNGIDLKLWNPATDPHIKIHYSSDDSLEKISKVKAKNKEFLINRYSLSPTSNPWVGAVTRLVPQKNPELIEEAIAQTLRLGGVFLLLGSSPIPEVQSHFEELREQYAGNPQVLLQLHYEDALAHQIYAALDFLVVPSNAEPCGLTQMIGMHYGVLPIARATGGLKDTIVDCENGLVPSSHRNGFLFERPTAQALNDTLDRALHLYRTNPATFQNLMRAAMQMDFGWHKPCEEYLKVFRASPKPSVYRSDSSKSNQKPKSPYKGRL